MKTKPYLAFSELTKRVYIVHGKAKTDVTEQFDMIARERKTTPAVIAQEQENDGTPIVEDDCGY